MKRFRDLLESDGDHEYWKSMPVDHLHAETHRLLTSHGYETHNHNTHGTYYVRSPAPGFLDYTRKLGEMGWKRTGKFLYDHPNGSQLIPSLSTVVFIKGAK